VRQLMPRLALAALTIGSISLSVPAAHAAAPAQTVETVPFSIPTWTDCANYGGTGIISATGTIERRVQVRTDQEGTVQEVRHVHFTGTLTGPGGTATYEGSFRALFEDPAGLFVRSGQSKYFLPGRKSPLVAAGRQVVLRDEVLMATPRGSAAFSQAAVCEAIGG
jgi:hypothetical protein